MSAYIVYASYMHYVHISDDRPNISLKIETAKK